MAQDNYALQQKLPSDERAETNILGTMMYHEELFVQVEDVLDSSMFYVRTNQAMFRILKYIIQKKQVVDESSIMACYEKFKGKIGVTAEEVDIAMMEIAASDSPSTFMQDVERIVEYSVRRKTWETMMKMAAKAITLTDNADDTITEAVRQLDSIRGSVNADSGIIDAKDAVKMVYDQINDNLAGMNTSTVKTGFRFSDAKGGIRLNNVVVIGAWTSVGKSSLALNIAVNAATAGYPVAYYSLEMGAVELWSRIFSSYTNISAGKILSYPLRRDEVAEIDRTSDELSKLPIYIDDKATTRFSKMIRSVRTMVKKHGIKMFVVDYLQIFAQNNKSSSEESNIASMARECKNICRELNICCLLLSQLRRDKDERHPTIDMLRGSGQIEESADNIVLIDRPDAHPEWGVSAFGGGKNAAGLAELRVCKGRNIGLGTYYVGFDANRTQFYELDGYKIGDEIGYDDGKVVGIIEEPTKEQSEPTTQSLPF